MLVFGAVAMVALLGCAGLAIDAGRMYSAKARLQLAVDSAALAGALRLPEDPEIKVGKVGGSVNEYLTRNYPEARLTNLTPGTEVRSVNLCAEVDVPMTFSKIVGADTMTIEACAAAGFNDLEVALVIDNSGSMEGSPINSVKTAAKKLLDLMIPDGTAPAIKVALVPFRGKVRVDNWDDGLPPGCRNADGTVNTKKVTDTCINAMPAILGLSTSKTTIKTAINSMTARRGAYASGTLISEGIKWGRYTLDPDEPFTEGRLSSEVRKVMILLSDGDCEDGSCFGDNMCRDPDNVPCGNYLTNAYFGMNPPVTNCNCGPGAQNWNSCLDVQVRLQADLAKDADIEIFVIRYGTGSDANDKALMRYVASSKPGTNDHYFDAPTVNDIPKVFDLIGRQLGFRLL